MEKTYFLLSKISQGSEKSDRKKKKNQRQMSGKGI